MTEGIPKIEIAAQPETIKSLLLVIEELTKGAIFVQEKGVQMQRRTFELAKGTEVEVQRIDKKLGANAEAWPKALLIFLSTEQPTKAVNGYLIYENGKMLKASSGEVPISPDGDMEIEDMIRGAEKMRGMARSKIPVNEKEAAGIVKLLRTIKPE